MTRSPVVIVEQFVTWCPLLVLAAVREDDVRQPRLSSLQRPRGGRGGAEGFV